MYKNDQGHVKVFCIVFVRLETPRSLVRIIAQVQWFLHKNQLEPPGGVYHLYKRKLHPNSVLSNDLVQFFFVIP